MSLVIKKMPPALRHGGYSVMSLLPGESAAEFAKLHRELVAEWTPNGALEGETVATMARALWRKKNLQTLRIAKLAQERMARIHGAMVPGVGEDPASDQANQLERTFIQKCRAAEAQARQELGELYALVEMGEEATIDHLMQELQVQERLERAGYSSCTTRIFFICLFCSYLLRIELPRRARSGMWYATNIMNTPQLSP
jgi:hypothetical protein